MSAWFALDAVVRYIGYPIRVRIHRQREWGGIAGIAYAVSSFTFSDIKTRLIPVALARAYPDRALTADDLLIAAAEIEPTPAMREVAE